MKLEILKSADELGSPAFGEEIKTTLEASLSPEPEATAPEAKPVNAASLPPRASEEYRRGGVISKDKVRVRDYPYEEGTTIVSTLNTGAEVEILERTLSIYTIGENSAPWYRIASPEGWVFGAFVEAKQ